MSGESIPIMRPKLPTAAALLPYLEQIDRSRVYSNFGPLAARLEDRLAEHYGIGSGGVLTVVNGTLGLTIALMAQDPRPGTLCLIPAWTFIASAQAAELAGLVPHFVDVDPATWALDPHAFDQAIADAPGEVGAVMPVVPFGRPIDVTSWNEIRLRTGLAVVIDAAAGFDALKATATPAVVSLHATKVLATGEGGFILCDDRTTIRRMRARANFGFDGRREAMVPALNAKLSEYHAAVGHAALDDWRQAREEWFTVARGYRDRMASSVDARIQAGFGESWVSSVCVFELDGPDADPVEDLLGKAGIETRRWWGGGAHAHASTRQRSRAALPTTNRLARSTIGVPFFRDMKNADIDRVVSCVRTSRI